MILNISKEYSSIECCVCGVIFAVSAPLFNKLKETQKSFYCPNGHSQSFTKSTLEILKERLSAESEENCRLQNEVAKLERENKRLSRKRKTRRK